MQTFIKSFVYFGFFLLFFVYPKAAYPETCNNSLNVKEKIHLWNRGTYLRGVNIWQKVIVEDFDGDAFGTDVVGPPYPQENLDKLAQMGANYVNISFPGFFTEKPPYVVQPKVVAYFDALLARVQKAGLFAVLSFRTGPGRNESGFDSSEVANALHKVWTDPASQNAWVQMWEYVAQRYKNHPVIAGYHFMVEPNADEVLKIWDPEVFYKKYKNSSFDWNVLSKRIAQAVRKHDKQIPLLLSGMGWSSIRWMSYIEPLNDPRVIYIADQYEPYDYTHEAKPKKTYPGFYDLDGDGQKENFDKRWLEDLYMPLYRMISSTGAPVSIQEFGVMRWQLGGDKFLKDSIDIIERYGANHALWLWETSLKIDYNHFNFRYGPDPRSKKEVVDSELMRVIKDSWAKNKIRPKDTAGCW